MSTQVLTREVCEAACSRYPNVMCAAEALRVRPESFRRACRKYGLDWPNRRHDFQIKQPDKAKKRRLPTCGPLPEYQNRCAVRGCDGFPRQCGLCIQCEMKYRRGQFTKVERAELAREGVAVEG